MNISDRQIGRLAYSPLAATVAFLTLSSDAYAVDYYCLVEKKSDFEREFSQSDLERGKFGVLLMTKKDSTIIGRCSYESVKDKVTCDYYTVDYQYNDTNLGGTKYYFFSGQFDVQIFPNLIFIENNGRSTVAWGRCRILPPQ